MKFTCDKFPLLSALSASARATVVKSTIPSLEGILLEADNDSLKITGYDLKTGIVTKVSATVDKAGAIVINARLLCEIIRKMPGNDVTISLISENIVEISSDISKLEIIGSPMTDYPELPTVEEQEKIEINSMLLKKMISQTNFAVSENESRPIHTGALFETGEGVLTIVAVDGYRLALRREEIKEAVPKLSFVVPGAALGEVERILSDEDSNITIMLGSKHIVFKIEETTLISRRLEGDFLNYRNAVPESAKYRIKVEKSRLISSIDRVSTVISDKLKSPVRCVFEDGVITLRSASAIGKANDECTVEGDGEGLEIGFNDKYFMEALRAAPSDEVILELNSGTTPCVITPSGEVNNFLYMILPVRLKAEG